MFLRSIRIRNFLGFSDLSMSFVQTDAGTGKESIRKNSILLGNNGTGKSNVLKAIGLVTAGRSSLAELLTDSDLWIQNGKRFCQIDAMLQTQKGEQREVSLRIDRGLKKHEILDRNADSLAELDNALEHAERNYFVLGYGASRRLNSNRTSIGRTSQISDLRATCLATLFRPDASLNSLEAWAMDLDYRKDRKTMTVIREVLSRFLRDVKFVEIDKTNRQLMFRTADGLIPMSSLSDGYQNVAAWVGDLLYRVTETFEDYSKPMNTRGLLLIDEIDLHLHPLWQKELLDFLHKRLPNMQLVATTHSPITAQQTGPGELFFLERSGKKLSLNQYGGNPKELLLHQLIMSDAFGLPSDESSELEKKKNRLKVLKSSGKLSTSSTKEQSKLEKEISDAPVNLRRNAVAPPEQIELLKSINAELQKRR